MSDPNVIGSQGVKGPKLIVPLYRNVLVAFLTPSPRLCETKRAWYSILYARDKQLQSICLFLDFKRGSEFGSDSIRVSTLIKKL